MASINCPECGTGVSNRADKCPNCAYPIKEHNKGCFLETLDWGCSFIWAIVILIVIIAVLALFFA